jgi:hypothetical protein
MYCKESRRNIPHKTKSRKAYWIGHNSCRNCILSHVTEENKEGQGRGGRRCRHLQDDLKIENRKKSSKSHWWRAGFGRVL